MFEADVYELKDQIRQLARRQKYVERRLSSLTDQLDAKTAENQALIEHARHLTEVLNQILEDNPNLIPKYVFVDAKRVRDYDDFLQEAKVAPPANPLAQLLEDKERGYSANEERQADANALSDMLGDEEEIDPEPQ